jgi:hypothetical protein
MRHHARVSIRGLLGSALSAIRAPIRKKQWFEERELEHSRAVEHVASRADFRSYRAFYDDRRRRGEDEHVGQVVDGEFRWTVHWIPGSSEVVAFAASWTEPQWHQTIEVTGSADSGPNGLVGVGVAPVPELVLVLGRAPSADYARELLLPHSTLASIRAALAR